MKDTYKNREHISVGDEVVEIEPIPFRSGRGLKHPKSFNRYGWLIALGAGIGLALLLVSGADDSSLTLPGPTKFDRQQRIALPLGDR